MDQIHIILFYKFTDIANPEEFAKSHLSFCKGEELVGKVLVANEGINGSLSGSKEQVGKYKRYLTGIEQFSDVVFREETCSFHPFKKMVVRVKNEIIRMEQELDLTKRGKYITPEELLELYETDEDFIILDARNRYESEVGRFKNAITPDIETFREFPEALKSFSKVKDKKIVTYCTGGIRCEKATAYMLKEGFTNVYQLKGGIINFCQKHHNTVWNGKCFVFDQRLISDVDPESGSITTCVSCNESCDKYRNCKHVACDNLIILCDLCTHRLNGCCSQACAEEYSSHVTKKSQERQAHHLLREVK